MPIALSVEDVSKQYRIYEKPGDRLTETLTRGRLKRHREFWALRDVGFEVEAGTTVGLIGPNGGGKSTLLQIIAGTLEPTHGRVVCAGRTSALLELGAGFNPEFTGVENVMLNGSLMGLSRRETEALLPAVERFAEIGDFIRQPVKTYSSGMYVRLAFSIAISVDPQLLIVDEALAVGDAVFQHRCLRRIKELQEGGATILFVSHDPGAVRALCSRAILLNSGRVVKDGAPSEALSSYQRLIMAREEAYAEERAGDAADLQRGDAASPAAGEAIEAQRAALRFADRHGDRSAEVIAVTLLDADNRPAEIVETGETVRVRVRLLAHQDLESVVCGMLIRNRHGVDVYGTNTELNRVDSGPLARGEMLEATFSFDCWLAAENFSLTVAAHSPDAISYDWLEGALFFRVVSQTRFDGVANLNAAVATRKLSARSTKEESPAALTYQPQ